MTAIEELLKRHQEQDRVTRETPAPPALHVVILTCMDARINPAEVFGLQHGEAHVLRNAGGVVTDDVIRSLALSQHALGTTEVIVMQHTSCGVSTVTEDGFKDQLEQSCGLRPTWSVEAFRDVTDSVRTSVQRVKRSPYLPHTDNVRGFVYDIQTGDLTEVQ
ncbi:carbonic anhydrase [Amycolatopsis bartoniae]|uniref:carbonic anhydrase n=1 Tax=Amycolatopsis bartoniae TaxID=941986 RepID=A0A8H9IXJ3_9PSEU|nr:carbonic anhydrase [Amycolatopsis bartoniae]MBB2935114.1 carbonic anhydrase [Amycolatopsis bartoniae]TVT06994.1 carbonic anhydrase [Amycolatopsis bartoniae]GHF74455.1 carbonic anhydrase [Amycolatopsis bartoniae]